MKIKCITNKVIDVPKDLLSNYSISYDNFNVIEGKEYLVYACAVYINYIWYCICNESYFFYPNWNPSMLFEVTDARLSHYWIFGLKEDNKRKTPFLSFPEWVNNPYFYAELIDGDKSDPNAIIFSKYKELMDLEFPDLNIAEIAQIGDEKWLICPFCIDAWQSLSKDGMVICPKCKHMLHNPRYEDKKISLISDALPD